VDQTFILSLIQCQRAPIFSIKSELKVVEPLVNCNSDEGLCNLDDISESIISGYGKAMKAKKIGIKM
jgi:hypothetical protein